MNGAEHLVKTLVASGVEVCFANPGTSEMHLVHAIDRVEGLRPVLGLFEGVVTGAADGYARMADKPAATLLHLGPGFGNGLANIHNAKKASTPMVNIVGEHATYHRGLDAPLTSDIEGIAWPVSHWVKTAGRATDLGPMTAEAVAAAQESPGRIATLIVPADTAWNEVPGADGPYPPHGARPAPRVSGNTIGSAAEALRKAKKPVLLLAGKAMREQGVEAAGRIAAATGAELLSDTFNARMHKGAGRVQTKRLPYFGEMALDMLQGVDLMVIVGTKAPVAFFAYPGKPSRLVPEGCETLQLATPEEDVTAALEALADELGAPKEPVGRAAFAPPDLPSGDLTAGTVGQAVGALLPEGAIVADESVSSGLAAEAYTATAAPHDWMQLTGGSIGMGLPLATGAAIACPDRKVICLEGDGSAMYTVQALWTQAREGLDVTTVIFANRSYAILNFEFHRVGADNPGERAMSMLDIGNPTIDWQAMAKSMGVNAFRAETTEQFIKAFQACMKEKGPHLIEAVI